jgi:hypothetical protein
MVASIDIAYVVRDTAADHPGLTAPARIIGMRSQGEAEIAIEQGETRYEGVTWTTRRQIAANRLIPLPEPARRGLINLADEVIATTNRAVAAAAQVDTGNLTRSIRSDRATDRRRSSESIQIARPQNPAPKDHAGETACHHPSRTRQRLLAQNPLAAICAPGHNVATRQNSQWSVRFASAEERDPAGKEHDHETAHGHRRRGDRHAQGWPQRRVPADRSKSAGVNQHRPPAAGTGRLDPPNRSPECGVVYVASGLALRS